MTRAPPLVALTDVILDGYQYSSICILLP